MEQIHTRQDEQKPADKKPHGSRARLFLGESAHSEMDAPFLIAVFLLLAFGMVMLYSVSYAVAYYHEGDSAFYIKRQLVFAVLGLVAMFVISRLDYHFLRKIVWLGYIVTLCLLVIALFMPARNYAHRWIFLPTPSNPIISFQPSEIAKLELILAFAHLGSANQSRIKDFKHGVLPYAMLAVPVIVLVFVEPHLSGTVLLVCITAVMMFAAGTPLKWFFAAALAVVAVAAVAFTLNPELIPVFTERIDVWLDPDLDPTGDGMQVRQGLMAIGSGGITGLGLGNSRQKYMYVPEPYNDAIFTIICEELGFVGAMIILLLFAFLLIRGIHVALCAKDRFGMLLVIGIISQVILQAILNILVVTGTIPYTGITLPFFSYGGTALTLLLAEMGVVLSVSRQGNHK